MMQSWRTCWGLVSLGQSGSNALPKQLNSCVATRVEVRRQSRHRVGCDVCRAWVQAVLV